MAQKTVRQVRTTVYIDVDTVGQNADIRDHDAIARPRAGTVLVQAVHERRAVNRQASVGVHGQSRRA